MKIAIIPARGGSKRIPRKNIKDFNGKPIIAYSIEAALSSGCFDKVIVSTDDQEIATVAKNYGAEVPFIRPQEVSDDYATTAQVLLHAIDWYEEKGVNVELICCIYATAPFITPKDLVDSHEFIARNGDADYCFAVTEFPFPIQRGIKLDGKGRVAMFQPEHFNTRSQDLEPAYYEAGQFCWGRPQAYRKSLPVYSERGVGYPIPRTRVVDLDTPEDWEFALLLSKALNVQLY
ncbi:TPA: pseudaminic acid cytidylyltransferase [Vibrio vulnificus]|uniref:Pseudaminic acid cytidylyltransferase n=1 Tax=Vibrio vulnificus TaxID=672 RepID=A0A2S3R622_VIBVL|nr:pseudaminic acid cytidylyltransferase [Vibrio vulnificus]EHH0749891.1 pseudaminic acid cytidylyltransferase [Vibrio vulnificus]ELP6757205.1 pseudaminic acid cytidylyltransferase [Vibrio vulnificus]MDK2620914.1 pseudaminic acid cytidylyltransferase [Vibrio vulnificus]POB49144.1 pseudaminic acid cytidylyltransferase [Vibrio vulnificus]RAH20240.1 pseudaminic acid cytidylyltransferase [Vibrio vulnificus]